MRMSCLISTEWQHVCERSHVRAYAFPDGDKSEWLGGNRCQLVSAASKTEQSQSTSPFCPNARRPRKTWVQTQLDAHACAPPRHNWCGIERTPAKIAERQNGVRSGICYQKSSLTSGLQAFANKGFWCHFHQSYVMNGSIVLPHRKNKNVL